MAVKSAPDKGAGKKGLRLDAAQVLVIGFLTVIIVGGTLLMLPAASADGRSCGPETAYFTAVSCTCVTGLAVRDTGTSWSVFGQIVMLVMIQTGGLGFMTMAVMLSTFIKRAMSPKEKQVAAASLGFSSRADTIGMVRRIFLSTGIIEGVGALLLMIRFVPMFGARGIWYGVFHSISAFCNAGFDLFGPEFGPGSSVAGFVFDPYVNIVLMALILTGGIGFAVWYEVKDLVVRRKRLSSYARMVILMDAALVFGGAALIFVFDMNHAFAGFTLPQKILASVFQSVTTRTAGFAAVDNTLLSDPSKALSIILMFMGGASGSTAGGVKINTIAVLLIAVRSISTGQSHVTFGKRSIPNETVLRAMAVTMFALTLTITSSFIVSLTDRIPLMVASYECVSAAATVGLTLNATPSLSTLTHCLLMALMFLGRVGGLTVVYSLTMKHSRRVNLVTYPDMSFPVG